MRIFIQILVCLFLLPLLNSQTPRDTVLVLKPSIEQYHKLNNPSGVLIKYFNITIDKKLPQEDLLIMVRPVEDISDPDIFISSTFQYPDSYSNSEMICTSNGLDVCTIPESNITDNKTFYIGIKCYTQCSFALKATYSEEDFFSLSENPNTDTLLGTYNLEFQSNDAKIVKFFIPENNNNFQRMLVRIQQIHPQQINESFSFFMNEGANPPTTSKYHFKGIEAWNSGQCILVTDNYSNLWSGSSFGGFSRSNVNYTLLIQAPQGSNLQVRVQAYNDLMKVKLHQNLQDMVYMDSKITYELNIDDDADTQSAFQLNTLMLTLTAFSGNPDIYVHPDTLPNNITDYKWKSTEEGKESLVITSAERQAAKATDKKFYITIYGKLTSTFSLWIGTSQVMNYLTFGVAQTGEVENDEIINYRLFIFGEEDLNITASLGTENGNPDLYVKMCMLNDSDSDWRMAREERLKCRVSLDDIQNRYLKSPEVAEMFIFSDNVGGKDSVSFLHDAEKCTRQNNDESRPFMANKCMYVVGVHGNCNWQNESQFSLVVTHAQHHIVLTEGEAQRNRADLGVTSYFKFTLMDDRDVQSVKFLITEISGRVSSYVSKKIRYPSEQNYDKMSYSHWGNLSFDMSDVKNTTEKLAGSYYVAIYSETAATYSILTSVKRKVDEKSETKKYPRIKLSEGVPQYYSFVNDPNEKHFFRFKTSLSKNASDVMIHLTPIRGDYNLFVLNTKKSDLDYPTTTDYHFTLGSHESTLLIRNTSKNFTKKATYIVLVDPVVDQGGDHNLYEFIIQYSTSDSMKVLSSHNPLSESVANDTYSYYRCEAHKGDESIEISINVVSFNPYFKTMLQVFFSFQSSNPFPDESRNEFNTTVQNNIWIIVENSDLTTNCPWLFQDNLNYSKQCVFYMSIRAFEADVPEIVYSINTKRNFIEKSATIMFDYLSDNSPKTLHYNPENPEPFYFLYKLEKTRRALHVSAFTQDYYSGANFVLMAHFFALDTNLTATKMSNNFPKPEQNVQFVVDSEWHHSVSFTIYQDQFKSQPCIETEGGCGLFISIYLNSDSYYYSSGNSTFTIQVTRKLITLTPGVPINGLVIDNEIKYFRLDIDDEQTTILISVTPLNDGDPDLIVNKGITREWPDLFNYDYASKNTNADQLSIDHYKDQNNTDNNSYVIGVYGKKNCSFVLTATYGDFHLVYLYEGSPNSYMLKAKEKIYFKYNNYYSDQDFRMILSKDYGDYLWAMKSLKDTEDFVENLPDFGKKNYVWSNMDGKDLDHVYVQKENKNYCTNCSYVLVVQAEKESSFTVLVAGNNQTIYLQHAKSFKDFVKSKSNNSYVSYFYDDVSKIIVNILVYSGKIKVKLYNSTYMDSGSFIESGSNEFSNNIVLTYKPDNSSYWYYNMVSVLIYGSTSSNYTIAIHGEGRDRNIRYGITEYGDASPFAKYNFTFYSNTEEESNQYYSLTLKTNYNSSYSNQSNGSSGFNENGLLDNCSLKITFSNNTHEKISIYGVMSRSTDYIFARFKAFKGDFVITVDNSLNIYGFSYNILLSFSGMDLIYPDTLYVNYLNVGKANYYQMLTEPDNKVLVELFQCYGKNKLYVASNQNNILNHQSDLKSELENMIYVPSNQIFNMYKITNLTEMYIAVKSFEGGNNDFFNNTYKVSRYLLKTHVIKSGQQTPYEVFFPGDSGNIFFVREGNSLVFNMKRLICGEKDSCKSTMMNNLKNAIKYYKYTIKFNYDAHFLEESVTCFQMFNTSVSDFFSRNTTFIDGYFDTNSFIGNLESTRDLSFVLNLDDKNYIPNTPYYAKVYAQVFIEENLGPQPYTFFYKTVEFYPGDSILVNQNQESSSTGLIWILVIVLIALVGAVVAAFIFFNKYKKTATQLNYELQDVTKVARVDEPPKRKDYIGLINESHP